MNTPDRLEFKSPTNILFRTVKADFRKLLPTMGKASINAVMLKWEDLAKDGVEVANTLGVKQDEGELAWLWVSRSVLQAILRLCKQQEKLLPSSLNFGDLTARLNQVLESDNLGLDNDFFQRPDQHSLTKILQKCFIDWLAANQVNVKSITEISKGFNYYFIFNLYQEAKTNGTIYQPIEWRIKQLNEKAGETEKAWLKYGLWLQEQVDERLFGVEDFSLRQIYIPLRTCVIREKKKKENSLKNKEKEYERVVMNLHSAIRDWLQQEDKRDGLRIICGGPGCGKSSFTKMLAAKLAEKGDRVLWIPLHLLDPTKDLVKALDELIDGNLDSLYPPNPLKKEQSQQRLLVILDGLDELDIQATEVAQQFLQQVKKDLRLFNQSSLRVQVLVSGREWVVRHLGEAKDSQQILHLLPYWLSKEDLEKDSYVDEQTLL